MILFKGVFTQLLKFMCFDFSKLCFGKVINMFATTSSALLRGSLFVVLLSVVDVDAWAQTEKTIKKSKWELLSVDKWRGINSENFPSSGWKEKGNIFTVLAGEKGGDIITKEKYSDFELMLEFNLTPSANSGIKYFVELIQNPKTDKVIGMGPEYQVIDDFNHKEVKENQYSTGSTGALYLLYEPSKDKKLLPAGKWNKMKIVAKDNHVEHWLNGKKIVSYNRGTEGFRSRVAASKFKDVKNYGQAKEGYILLQEHRDEVSFRNIKIKRL